MIVNGWDTCPRCPKNFQKDPGDAVLVGIPYYRRKWKVGGLPTHEPGREGGGE